MDDRISARRGTYRVIYRIDDKARVVTLVDVCPPPRCLPDMIGRVQSGGLPNNH